jgi:hypothetical protein
MYSLLVLMMTRVIIVTMIMWDFANIKKEIH